jgi:hypothetical protein
MPDLIPDWDGDSEEERQEPHKRAKHQENLTVEISLQTDDGTPIPYIDFHLKAKKGFEKKGRLDEHGTAAVSIPKGEYTVNYLNKDKIYLSALAIKINKAFDKSDTGTIKDILLHKDDVVKKLNLVYDEIYKPKSCMEFHDKLRSIADSHNGVFFFNDYTPAP